MGPGGMKSQAGNSHSALYCQWDIKSRELPPHSVLDLGRQSVEGSPPSLALALPKAPCWRAPGQGPTFRLAGVSAGTWPSLGLDRKWEGGNGASWSRGGPGAWTAWLCRQDSGHFSRLAPGAAAEGTVASESKRQGPDTASFPVY